MIRGVPGLFFYTIFIFPLFLILELMEGGIFHPHLSASQKLEMDPVKDLRGKILAQTGVQPYTYRAGTRRDPFTPFQRSDSHNSSKPAISLSEKRDGDLTLLGIISGKGGYQALLQMPDGNRLIVEAGTWLETVSGAVERISRESVVIARPAEGKPKAGLLKLTLSSTP